MVIFPALSIWLVRQGEDSSQSNCCSKCFWHPDVYSVISHAVPCAVSGIPASTSVDRSGGICCCYFTADTEEVLPHEKQTHSCVTPVLLQRQSQQQICFSLSILTGLQVGNSLSISAPDAAARIPPRLCGCPVLFRSTIPRQLRQDGKLIFTWQTQAGTNVLSLILLCAGSLLHSCSEWQKVNAQEIWDSWWCFMPYSYNCRKHWIHFIPAKWNLDTQLRKTLPMGFPVAPIAGFAFCHYEEIVQRIYRFRSYNGELLALWIILLLFLYLYHMLNNAVKFGCDFYCFTVLKHS